MEGASTPGGIDRSYGLPKRAFSAGARDCKNVEKERPRFTGEWTCLSLAVEKRLFREEECSEYRLNTAIRPNHVRKPYPCSL